MTAAPLIPYTASVTFDQALTVTALGDPGDAQRQLTQDPAVALRVALEVLTPGADLFVDVEDTPAPAGPLTPGVTPAWTPAEERETREAFSAALSALCPRHAEITAQLAAEAQTRAHLTQLLTRLDARELLLLAYAQHTGRADLLGQPHPEQA